MSDTIAELRKLIQKSYDVDLTSIDPHKPLSEFGLDSLSLAELVFIIEDHFHIDYPDDRTGVQTLAELADVVDDMRALAPAT
ncbi:phosphopantetheine-binding protein [Methylibium sp.]|uniref:acyl carrier protein n=1 Tax=Methylibium sp. TaxID=2067992 RepID=UPI00286D1506|nr:phosphopantetheine-binding protein [Methylibium sp.]